MISRAREREIDLEHVQKRKSVEGLTTGASGKKPKGSDSRPKGQAGRDRCGKCGRSHEGVFRIGSGSGCYKCSKTGHFGKDCTALATLIAARTRPSATSSLV